MKTFFALSLALSAAMVVADDHGHDHHAGHKCACEAIVLGFEINCENKQAMLDALGRLRSGGCGTDCHSEACEKDWMIVQSHHDHCPVDSLPREIENDFHDYDEVCAGCDISRQPIPDAPTCPSVSCDDGSGNAAYQRLLSKNCAAQFKCTVNNCKDDYLTLRVVHDTCDHGALSQAAEEGLHSLEEPCAAFECNLDGDANSLECSAEELEQVKKEHDEHDDDHEDGDKTDDEKKDDDKKDDDKKDNMSPPTAGGFDMGISGAANKFATGSIAAMTIAAAALF